MRLVSYASDGAWRAGVVIGESVVDAEEAGKRSSLPGRWSAVREVIAQPADQIDALGDAADRLVDDLGVPLDGLELGPPIPDPQKILCIGLNYREHQEETSGVVAGAQEVPRYPIVFTKFPGSLIGTGAKIEPPKATNELDFEAELAVVIGKETREVGLADALDSVAGYAAFNDVSARDLQLRSSQWTVGKAFDTAGPFGPWLVTPDEIADPQDLEIVGRLNGQVVQQSSTALMIFSIAQLIEYLSQVMTLVPGDVIATGTPSGVGMSREPALYMNPGDVFEVEIEGIGSLVNPIAPPRSDFRSILEDS